MLLRKANITVVLYFLTILICIIDPSVIALILHAKPIDRIATNTLFVFVNGVFLYIVGVFIRRLFTNNAIVITFLFTIFYSILLSLLYSRVELVEDNMVVLLPMGLFVPELALLKSRFASDTILPTVYAILAIFMGNLLVLLAFVGLDGYISSHP